MTLRSMIAKFAAQEDVNFVLTNRIPRRLATRFVGWFSRIENPVICALSLRIWQLFTDLDLSEAQETQFRSLHHCFTRRLRDGARPVDRNPATLVSPCDGIVGAFGRIADGELLQIKGAPYTLDELLGDPDQVAIFRNGHYLTLRLTSAMYHRFHAPYDGRISTVTHIFGDRWNVNPVTLRRVARLFCKNERAIIRTTLPNGQPMTLVPVAAILVAGIKLCFLDITLKRGETRCDFPCDTGMRKGDELGWFEHGSTIIMLLPSSVPFTNAVQDGALVKAGQAIAKWSPH